MKMKGIVLNGIKYKDNQDIVYLYTDTKGRSSCIFSHKKRRTKLSPLSLIEFEESSPQKAELHYIKDVVLSPVLHDISTNVKKSAIAMFVGEFLYKVLKEEEANPPLFEYISKYVRLLDMLDEGIANFHLYFIVQISKYLGFSISTNTQSLNYFDIKLSKFAFIKPLHPQYFSEENTKILSNFLVIAPNQLPDIKLTGEQRLNFANSMIDFFSFRFDQRLNIKSLNVLHEIFL